MVIKMVKREVHYFEEPVKREVHYFEEPGSQNTSETIKAARKPHWISDLST